MTRALVLFAHPCPESFSAALHARAVAALEARGWEVDDCNLNAEGFDPVLSAAERRGYHDTATNAAPVAGYVERLRAAQALVLVFPVWNFGYPAILHGFLDRVFRPGISFDPEGPAVRPALTRIRTLAAVTTCGGDRRRAVLAGDPPRNSVTRHVRHVCRPDMARYPALCGMNDAADAGRGAFAARAEREMAAP